MTLYRMASTMLVLSSFCLAASLELANDFFILCSTICLVLAGQLYASGVEQEKGQTHSARRR